VLAVAALVAAGAGAPTPLRAQEGWNPFADITGPASPPRRPQRPAAEPGRPPLAPMDALPHSARGSGVRGAEGPEADAVPQAWGAGGAPLPRTAVETSDLELLGGTSAETVEAPATGPGNAAELAKLFAGLAVPSASPALTRLLVRVTGPDGAIVTATAAERAVRGEMLYRAGRIAQADAVVGGGAPAGDPLLAAIGVRIALARGDRDRACRDVQAALQSRDGLPASIRVGLVAIQGYCAAAQGNAPAASLAASLLREEAGAPSAQTISELTLPALDGVGVGEPVRLDGKSRITAVDWRLASLAAREPQGTEIERMEPALLAALATAPDVSPVAGVAAAEAAARINAVDPEVLAAAYRRQPFAAEELAQALTVRGAPGLRRALLVRAALQERTPFKRTRLVRAALDDARRAGLYLQMAAALAPSVAEIRPVSEIGWFAETAVEVMLAAGRLEEARRWVRFAGDQGGGLAHWLGLIDIADPALAGQRGVSLPTVEEIALRGRFTAEGLHRLATLLDALDYHVPMRLWEAASRSPQPSTGHLPATGALSLLQDAAKRKDIVQTAVLVFSALGTKGPEGAHMIALGDAVRALRRAGLKREAREVATEALFQLWPRGGNG
jgi:hypothetical protein